MAVLFFPTIGVTTKKLELSAAAAEEYLTKCILIYYAAIIRLYATQGGQVTMT